MSTFMFENQLRARLRQQLNTEDTECVLNFALEKIRQVILNAANAGTELTDWEAFQIVLTTLNSTQS